EPKEAELFGRAAAAKSDCGPTLCEQVRDRDLLGHIERMMKVEADDGGSELDLPGLTSQVERKQQRCGKMPVVRMGMMLRKPGILHTKLIGQSHEVRHVVEDLGRRLVSRSFEVVGQADRDQAQGQYSSLPAKDQARDSFRRSGS